MDIGFGVALRRQVADRVGFDLLHEDLLRAIVLLHLLHTVEGASSRLAVNSRSGLDSSEVSELALGF